MNIRATEKQDTRAEPIAFAPPDPDEMVRIGLDRIKLGDIPNGRAMYSGAIDVQLDNPHAYNNLSSLESAGGHHEVALSAIRRSLAIDPDNPGALANIGLILWRMRRADEALQYLQRAYQLAPDKPDIAHNLGLTYHSLNMPLEAVKFYRIALELGTKNPVGCRSDMALSILKSGELHAGLVAHEVRWDGMLPKSAVWECGVPHWEGEDLNGKTLLMHAEQGFGDTIQFIRFLTELEERYPEARIIALVPGALLRLLAHNYGQSKIFDIDKPGEIVKSARGADFHCPMLSVVRVMGFEFGTLPEAKPYLRAPGNQSPLGVRRTLRTPGVHVTAGVVWQARPGLVSARVRSVALERMVRLAEVPGVRLFSLQYGPFGEELQRSGADCLITDLVPSITDFGDTASIMEGLDVIITVDSSTAHLAGALGKPVWMFNPFTPCWRWCRGAGVWYPSMMLFDQDRAGDDWARPLDQIAGLLGDMVRIAKEDNREAAHG